MDTIYKNPNANFFPQPSSTTISNEALANPAPLTLPNAPQDTTNYAGITASIPTFEQIQSQIGQTSQAETTADDLMQRILGTSAQVGQKAQRTLQAEQQAGLPQFQTQLQDVNSQLQALQKEALAIPLQQQENILDRGITTKAGLAPKQAGELRKNAIKSLTLSAIGQTLQGNIANAQATAQRAVDLEFAPLEAQLSTLKTAYEMNKDRLNRQDKKRADALNLQIAERTRLLDEQKADKKTVLDFVEEASKNGAPAVLVQRASEMNNPSEALAMLSQYMVDPMAKQQALADLAFKRAQTAKIYEDIALSKEELKQKYSTETGRKLTDAQATSLGYAQRIAEAGLVIDKLGSRFTGGGSLIGQFAPNILKSEDRQKFEQAQRNFINAVLRKESGAVISEEEFNNAKQQYFPQPGDTEGALLQKKQNRDTIYNNFIRNAGNPPGVTPIAQTTQVTQTRSGKPFDVSAALKAGYTQEEIDDYLNKN